jgi:hypothetical protein
MVANRFVVSEMRFQSLKVSEMIYNTLLKILQELSTWGSSNQCCGSKFPEHGAKVSLKHFTKTNSTFAQNSV